MKKLSFIILLCLGLFAPVTAQNIWKTINVQGGVLGAGPDGSLYAHSGYSGIARSQDEGETWQIVAGVEGYNGGYFNVNCFAVSPEGRIFVFDDDHIAVVYSDDNGDTWQPTTQLSSCAMSDISGLYAVTNNVFIVWTQAGEFYWTLDGGATWDYGGFPIDFFEGDPLVSDLIVNANGDVYVSVWEMGVDDIGVYHTTLDDLQNWELVAFEGLGIGDLEFDQEGNVVCAVYYGEGFSGFEHVPGFYAVDALSTSIADNGIIYKIQINNDDATEVLAYSTDHGEHFTEIGERMPGPHPLPGCCVTLKYITKGYDNYLYYSGISQQYYKSIRSADEILDQYPHPQPEHYWPEIVTSQPEGYVVDANGNVHIHSAEGLAWLISAVNGLNGQEADNFNGKTVTLEADVDMSAAIWTTIAQGTNYGDPNPDRLKFCGTFDGNGYDIIGLYLYYPTMQEFDAVFGHLCGATIKKVTVRHAYATGRSTRDGLFFANADAETIIKGCRFEVDEVFKSDFNEDYAVFGYRNEGTITNCMTKIKKIDYQGNLGINMDMFVLWNEGTIQNCASVADSVKWLYSYAGIAGTNDGLIENCYSFIGTFFGEYEIWWPPAPRQGMCFYNHGTIRNGYYNTLAPEYYITNNAAYVNNGSIEQTSPFDWNEGWLLTDSIMETNNLFEAINAWTNTQTNISDYLQWHEDYTVLPNGLPVLYEEEQYFPRGTEWYYEIKHLTGDITYQHLEYAADTAINSKRVKIIVETNTMYDKSTWTDVEYIYEDGEKIYWWNKDLEDFTLLYDFGAEVGDEWEINGGWFTITVHVDAVQSVTYNGQTYKMLSVSDVSHLFTGDILCGVGHLDCFFPESPIAKDFEVDGLRCFWQDGELVLTMGEEDCDAVYYELHGVDETPETAFMVYPNPTDGLLHVVETVCTPSLQGQTEYRVTNRLGQTLLTGQVETRHGTSLQATTIDVSSLPAGIYFLKINNSTTKFIVNQ